MKKVIVLFAVLLPIAAVAAYVAIAPVGSGTGVLGLLDALAARLSALAGRDVAVIALMSLGVLASVLAAHRAGGAKPARDQADAPDEAPALPWRPEPLSQDRIASLRRRGFVASDEPESEAREGTDQGLGASGAEASTAPTAPPVPPVLLLRKPRERERDWFGDSSWLGGLPRLGENPWPRGPHGAPLPFAAQIDLADLAAACPLAPLPHGAQRGALAFFLGSGAVLGIAASPTDDGNPGEDFSEPPHDLSPAFEEGGAPFPPQPSRLSRYFFPFWPVEPLALTVPDDLGARAPTEQEAALRRALAARLPALAATRPRPLRADEMADTSEISAEHVPAALWWHSAALFADQLDAAHSAAATLLAERRAGLHAKQHAASRMLSDPAMGPVELDAAEAEILALEDDLALLEGQRPALAQMVQALDGFVAGRDPWERLSAPEQALLGEILAEVNANYGDLVQGHAAASLAQLATASLRAMISGPPDALAALPDIALDRINREHRLGARVLHRMFGPTGLSEKAEGGATDDLLLLQLGADELMEWRWDEGKVFRFRIAHADAAAGNWAAATLSFEDA